MDVYINKEYIKISSTSGNNYTFPRLLKKVKAFQIMRIHRRVEHLEATSGGDSDKSFFLTGVNGRMNSGRLNCSRSTPVLRVRKVTREI